VKEPAARASEQSRTTRSAKPGLDPYFVEDVGMTRSEILQARNEDAERLFPVHDHSREAVVVLAA
jgi:hypothetical protein